MGQRRNRPSGNGSMNRNERSINNSREVSRRNKGKSRYMYEEDMRSSSRYYDGEEYGRKDRRRRAEAAPARRTNASYENNERRTQKTRRRRGRRKNGISKAIGIILAILQFVLSVVFVVNVMFFDMLTMTYVLVLIGVLIILLGITLLTQIGARGKGIGGKIFCIFLCVVLTMGSFYISKISGAFQEITGRNTKTSSVAVAVLKDNPAETIMDASGYNFGVQFTSGAAQMKSAISQIEKEVGASIQTTESTNLMEETQALYDGTIDAMIYNASYSDVISEQFETFTEDVKVIYTHNIVIAIENTASDASVEEPFVVYLSGIDTRENIIPEGSRSDVNLLAVVNPKSHQVLLVSTPRDYYVPIPGISGGQPDKLTHAGLYGVETSMATLSEIYDTEIELYGRINFTSMIDIVNALGGLEVESDQEFTTSPNAGKVFDVHKGMNTFDGKEALAFCRERKNLPDGDNARGRHQQMVITAIIKKMMSPAMLRGATKIIDSVSDGVDTNFSMEQIQTVIKNQLRSGAKWNIYSVQAEGFGDTGYKTCYSSGSTPLWVCVPDEQSVANISDLIKRVKDGEVITGSEIAE